MTLTVKFLHEQNLRKLAQKGKTLSDGARAYPIGRASPSSEVKDMIREKYTPDLSKGVNTFEAVVLRNDTHLYGGAPGILSGLSSAVGVAVKARIVSSHDHNCIPLPHSWEDDASISFHPSYTSDNKNISQKLVPGNIILVEHINPGSRMLRYNNGRILSVISTQVVELGDLVTNAKTSAIRSDARIISQVRAGAPLEFSAFGGHITPAQDEMAAEIRARMAREDAARTAATPSDVATETNQPQIVTSPAPRSTVTIGDPVIRRSASTTAAAVATEEHLENSDQMPPGDDPPGAQPALVGLGPAEGAPAHVEDDASSAEVFGPSEWGMVPQTNTRQASAARTAAETQAIVAAYGRARRADTAAASSSSRNARLVIPSGVTAKAKKLATEAATQAIEEATLRQTAKKGKTKSVKAACSENTNIGITKKKPVKPSPRKLKNTAASTIVTGKRELSTNGLAFIRDFEKWRANMYSDYVTVGKNVSASTFRAYPTGWFTIGWGSMLDYGHKAGPERLLRLDKHLGGSQGAGIKWKKPARPTSPPPAPPAPPPRNNRTRRRPPGAAQARPPTPAVPARPKQGKIMGYLVDPPATRMRDGNQIPPNFALDNYANRTWRSELNVTTRGNIRRFWKYRRNTSKVILSPRAKSRPSPLSLTDGNWLELDDIKVFEAKVNASLGSTVQITQAQFDVLVSIAYNTGNIEHGPKGLGMGSLATRIKANPKDPKIVKHIRRMRGDKKRRRRDSLLWRDGTYTKAEIKALKTLRAVAAKAKARADALRVRRTRAAAAARRSERAPI